MKDGTERHQRHENTIDMTHCLRIELTEGKARYYYFCGNKKSKKEMLNKLRFPILPYPKGESRKYDTSHTPTVQSLLF